MIKIKLPVERYPQGVDFFEKKGFFSLFAYGFYVFGSMRKALRLISRRKACF